MCVAHGLENVSKAEWTRVLEEIKKKALVQIYQEVHCYLFLLFSSIKIKIAKLLL